MTTTNTTMMCSEHHQSSNMLDDCMNKILTVSESDMDDVSVLSFDDDESSTQEESSGSDTNESSFVINTSKTSSRRRSSSTSSMLKPDFAPIRPTRVSDGSMQQCSTSSPKSDNMPSRPSRRSSYNKSASRRNSNNKSCGESSFSHLPEDHADLKPLPPARKFSGGEGNLYLPSFNSSEQQRNTYYSSPCLNNFSLVGMVCKPHYETTKTQEGGASKKHSTMPQLSVSQALTMSTAMSSTTQQAMETSFDDFFKNSSHSRSKSAPVVSGAAHTSLKASLLDVLNELDEEMKDMSPSLPTRMRSIKDFDAFPF